jgi:hypothetical protein
MSKGEVTVGTQSPTGNKPLYFGKPDTVYTRFLQGGESSQPGSSAIIRIVESPKTVSETLNFKGTVSEPQLSPGLYPSVKPITGTAYKGALQQEFIIPSGSKLSVKGVGYTDAGGAMIPVIDVVLGGRTATESINYLAQKFEYQANAFKITGGVGKPTPVLRGIDISMSNPLEEVVGKQWSPQQKAVLYPYMKEMALKEGSNAGLRVAVAGTEAIPAMREVKFVQREPAGEILVGKDLSYKAISDIYAGRERMGADVSSGGSTSIRANLGEGFFGKDLIGDIDAWAKAGKVESMWLREKAIIKSEIPDVDLAMSPRGSGLANTFLDLKIGKEAQGKFPVGAVAKPNSPKPIVEIHSIEQFPHVVEPSNVATLKTVGGHTSTGMSTGFLFERKISATFDKMPMTQSPYGDLKLSLSESNIKHGVGASAIAKEGASLFYGRDVKLTKMQPDYLKGKALETFSMEMDNLLSETKGASKAEVLKYQSSIKVNPLELKETRSAKTIAAIKSGNIPISKIFGVGYPDIPIGGKQAYPPSYQFGRSSNIHPQRGIGILSALTLGSLNINRDYPTSAKSSTYGEPVGTKSSQQKSYMGVEPQYPVSKNGFTNTYPNIYVPTINKKTYDTNGAYPIATANRIAIGYPFTGSAIKDTQYPGIDTPVFNRTDYPAPTPNKSTGGNPPGYPITTTGKPPNYNGVFFTQQKNTPFVFTPTKNPTALYPLVSIPKKGEDEKWKERRKLRKKQPFREIIPIEFQLFTKDKTQDFERRYTILKGTHNVVSGFMPPEYNPKFLPATQNYRATRGKGWIEAQYVRETKLTPAAAKLQTYQREGLPEPELGRSLPMHTIFSGTQGRINTRMAIAPPVNLYNVFPKRKLGKSNRNKKLFGGF